MDFGPGEADFTKAVYLLLKKRDSTLHPLIEGHTNPDLKFLVEQSFMTPVSGTDVHWPLRCLSIQHPTFG